MAYGNPGKKKMSYSKKKPRKSSAKTAQVGQRKAYRMTGKAPGN